VKELCTVNPPPVVIVWHFSEHFQADPGSCEIYTVSRHVIFESMLMLFAKNYQIGPCLLKLKPVRVGVLFESWGIDDAVTVLFFPRFDAVGSMSSRTLGL